MITSVHVYVNYNLTFYFRSVETYLLDNTGGFQVDRFFQSVGIFIGVFSGSFFLGFMMGLVTALVSFYFLWPRNEKVS